MGNTSDGVSSCSFQLDIVKGFPWQGTILYSLDIELPENLFALLTI